MLRVPGVNGLDNGYRRRLDNYGRHFPMRRHENVSTRTYFGIDVARLTARGATLLMRLHMAILCDKRRNYKVCELFRSAYDPNVHWTLVEVPKELPTPKQRAKNELSGSWSGIRSQRAVGVQNDRLHLG